MHRLMIAVATLAILVIGPQPAVAAQERCLEAPVAEYEESGIQGSAQLCTDSEGVRAELSVQELTASDAYTVWFIYFDRPGACAATVCSVPDMIGDDPLGVFARMDGLVADDTGEATFAGTFRDLRLSHGSEVHLVIFGHGQADPADNRMLARQLLTPQLPVLGAPGLGTVADGDVGHMVAFAIIEVSNDNA